MRLPWDTPLAGGDTPTFGGAGSGFLWGQDEVKIIFLRMRVCVCKSYAHELLFN